jgi:hypothetical protein
MHNAVRIGPSGWLLVARMTFWRLTLPVLRRAVNTERLVQLLAARRPYPRDPRRESLVLAVAGRLWRRSHGTCLERSLAAYHALGRIGASPRFVLAAAHDQGSIVGHAWVEVDGRAVLEATDPRTRFRAIVEYDAAGRLLSAQP